MHSNFNISAVTVSYNEGHLLTECFESLSFCDEKILIDLNSTDSSIAIAKKFDARIVTHPRVKVVEEIRQFAVSCARNEWVLLIDPDERVSPSIPEQLHSVLNSHKNVGMIRVPWLFFFKGKKIITTRWGFPLKVKPLVLHRKRVAFSKYVHSPFKLLNGFQQITLPFNGTNYLKHDWCVSYNELFSKHWRYIKEEGKARYADGYRFNLSALLYIPIKELKINLIDKRGMKGGVLGLFLSIFWSWYVFMREVSLWKYQKHLKGPEIC